VERQRNAPFVSPLPGGLHPPYAPINSPDRRFFPLFLGLIPLFRVVGNFPSYLRYINHLRARDLPKSGLVPGFPL
jgi:hypothetical protein